MAGGPGLGSRHQGLLYGLARRHGHLYGWQEQFKLLGGKERGGQNDLHRMRGHGAGVKYCFFIQYTIPPQTVHPQMHAAAASMIDVAPRIGLGPPERCPYCHSAVELVTGAEVYPNREDLADRHIWRCTSCDAHVGCHKRGARIALPDGEELVSDGTLPMGSLANEDLRAARIETHRMFDALWQPPACMNRREAYAWMAKLLNIRREEAHVASLSYDECVKVMLAIEDLTRAPQEPPALPGAAHWLAQAGIEFTEAPDGHFVVHAQGEDIDYWPDRQTWTVRTGLLADDNQGLHELILYCRRPKRASRATGGF